MTNFIKITVALGLFCLVGFVGIPKATKKMNESYNEESSSYSAVNISELNFIDKGYMVASWYGPNFHGKFTANGEVYDQMALTAAHKTMKLGTILRVTNPVNNKSVLVRINDRGPYIKGRNLDLSKGAAIALGVLQKGVVQVKIEELAVNTLYSPVVTL